MRKILNAAAILLSIFLAAGVKLVFHACGPKEDGSWMHCHTAENTVCICAVGMTLLLFSVLLLRNRKGAFVLSLLSAAVAVVTALLPNTIIHMCMMTNMRCHTVMKPTVIILSVMIALISVITGIMRLREKE